MKRVLVTGAGGLLGGRIAELLAADFEVVAAYRGAPPPAGLPARRGDLTVDGAIEQVVRDCDAVVHAAAMANADACEAQPQLAHRVNVDLPGQLARLCRRRGLRLVLISTDLVFDGSHAPYGADESATPSLVYGRTKLLGEEAVLAEAPDSAVARVALVWGRGHGHRGTSTEAILWALRRRQSLRLFTDQMRTPIDPESVAAALGCLLREEHSGRFHLGGPDRVSRYALGMRVARYYALDASLITPVEQSCDGIGAIRPADVSLDSQQTATRLGWNPRPLDAILADCRPEPDSGP